MARHRAVGIIRRVTPARGAVGATLALLLAAGSLPAQVSVDSLLAKIFASDVLKDPYELTAEFTGTLTLHYRGGRLTASAWGQYREWRAAGEPARHRRVMVERLDVPLLLRPFTPTLRKLIEEKIETQEADNPDTFLHHDIFILQDLGRRRYVLAGVSRDTVDEMLDRYGRPQDKRDPAVRRRIAQWLYTSPAMRGVLVRPGPPYALRAVVDEDGLLYDFRLFYDWGEVSTRIVYVPVNGIPVWRQVISDATSTVSGLGRVDGELQLTLSNHCLNCRR